MELLTYNGRGFKYVQADLTKHEDVKKLMKNFTPEIIFHSASITPSVRASVDLYYHVNFKGNLKHFFL